MKSYLIFLPSDHPLTERNGAGYRRRTIHTGPANRARKHEFQD